MSSLDADVNIILNAEDRASPQVAAAVKNMNTSWRDHLSQQRAVTRSYEIQNKTLFTTARAVQSVGSVVNRVLSIYNSFTLTQIRLQDAARNSADSLIDYNEALARFGQDSPEVVKAHERRIQTLKDEKEASDQARIGYALMAVSIIADTTRIVTSVIPRLLALKTVVLGTTAATAGLSATAGLGAVGGAAAGFATGAAIAGGVGGAIAAVPIVSAIDSAGLNPFQKTRDEVIKPALDNAVNQVFNFFGTSTDELVKKVQEATKGIVTFGQ